MNWLSPSFSLFIVRLLRLVTINLFAVNPYLTCDTYYPLASTILPRSIWTFMSMAWSAGMECKRSRLCCLGDFCELPVTALPLGCQEQHFQSCLHASHHILTRVLFSVRYEKIVMNERCNELHSWNFTDVVVIYIYSYYVQSSNHWRGSNLGRCSGSRMLRPLSY